jgi:hypothetical protein
MKKALLFAALFIAISVSAQKKTPPPVKKESGYQKPFSDTAHLVKDSVIQPTIYTPLLSFSDIQTLHDSVLKDVPYKFAPILDEINQWLSGRIQQKAAEYINNQKKKP